MYPVRGQLVRANAPGAPLDPGPAARCLEDRRQGPPGLVVERVRWRAGPTSMALIAFVSAASAELAVTGLRSRLLELTRPPSGPLAAWLLTGCSLGFEIADQRPASVEEVW